MNIIKKRSRLTDIENKPVVASGERGGGRRNVRVWEEGIQTTMCKINKLQGYIVQHREYSQYFIITINGILLSHKKE